MIVESPERTDATIPLGTSGGSRGRREVALSLLIPLVLLAVAGALRFYRLSEPARCYFDETYYYYQARDLRDHGIERGPVVHPPLGKWLIAGGLELFGVDKGSPIDQAVVEDPGDCPLSERDQNAPARAREAAESFARRVASATFGTLWVGVLYLAGLRLFRKRGTAAMAALLLAVDGLAFTMSRIAMLDVFLGFWVTVGFWLLLVDRDQQWAGVGAGTGSGSARGRGRSKLPRRVHWARWLAGVAFGLALATKWSAVLAIAAAGLFVLVSELAWRRRITGTPWVRLDRIVTSGLATLLLVPLVVYVASYATWYLHYQDFRPPAQQTAQAREIAQDWLDDQARIFRFHRDLVGTHRYRASAVTWPLMIRPVAFYWESCPPAPNDPARTCKVASEHVAEIVNLGNPVIWWLALPAYAALVFFGIRRRDWVAWAIFAFVALQYFPWLASPRPVYFFYAAPLVPFTCLAVAYGTERAGRKLRWAPAAVIGLALIGFLFWYPVYTGMEISRAVWLMRMWLPTWI